MAGVAPVTGSSRVTVQWFRVQPEPCTLYQCSCSLSIPRRAPAAWRSCATATCSQSSPAIAIGPGSFTGLRVGIASMQGLAFARGLTIVPVSTLEALAFDAAQTPRDETLLAPWVDAQRGEVFATLYSADASRILVPAASAPPLETLDAW